ncbi:transient receptor potential-gamma protein isoform X1 [Lingula anatina]|uniref:Transient receptor potential-gamma protein isoform X1 n=1 Tax=Lingula anatina TaxID=7574 RepID=A0A1S3KHZ0_LINAN|nr:transient receptor potential-gamma protein isoform X1 [Lingula anatina]XP_023933460.1 transient receptor potential-gamma protein isoform X1 [Lingula anatina]|eukprot:XP_013421841.2 transient receptor potential-gamma protein isoform X1 [Lingula anatina]
MDKVYRKYREQVLAGKIQDEIGIEAFQTDHFGSGVVRKENDLNNEEKQYLLAVERGDMANVRRYLEDAPVYYSININCTDPLGRSALLVAIENENLEMIELLLSFGVEMRDALLHAINEENVEAVELLLQYQASRKKDLTLMGHSGDRDMEGYLGGTPSDSFTPDITPIILAAHRDNYEIIKILLDRGDRIPKPHDVQCSCRECVANSSDDILRHSRSRINAYRALASPSLIALSSKDPVLTAFELSWELKRLSRIENEFKIEYEGLSVQCQDFAVDLLDQTRGSHELEIVLNHDSSGAVPHDSSPDRMKLSRLKLAIKYKQKKFVAHSNCQQLLASLWYEGLPGFRRRHIAFKVIMTSVIGMLFPLWSLIYIMVPKSSLGKLLRKPFVKFICHSSSYFTFLFLLILASQHIESIDSITLWGESKASSSLQLGEIRGAPPTIIEWMILLWVIGLIWAEIKQLWDEGAQEYIQDMWNILDFATNTLYIATITLRIVAYMNVERDVSGGVPTRYVPRKDWNAFDPNLIAEGTFAAANIFSTLKLIYIFTVNPHLGPLQISLGRMVMDIMKFMFVYFLALFSFACGINQLYWYYAAARRQECQVSENECKKNHEALSNLFEIMQTLYWGNFGLIDLEHFTLKEDHTITQLLLKLMFGTYSWIAIVVLLNMLIAMMSNSFQIISSMQDTEWKFARSKMWMSYFEEGGTLPAPFNIIPTPKTVWNILVWLKNVFCRCSKRQKRNRWQSIRKLVKKIHDREQKYQAVVRDLIKRYIMSKQRFKEDEGVTEDDINEIKTDVSSFRYELLEILRNNGMKIPEYTQNKPSSSKKKQRKKRYRTR